MKAVETEGVFYIESVFCYQMDITVRQSRPATLDELRALMVTLVSDLSDRSDLSDKSDKNALLATIAANTMICLVNQETYLLKRQIDRLAADFKNSGGFSERLYRVRKTARNAKEK